MEYAGFAALGWMFLASASGATPSNWHMRIAAVLIAAVPFIMWFLFKQYGGVWAVAFLVMVIFQLRMLLRYWLRKLSASRQARAQS